MSYVLLSGVEENLLFEYFTDNTYKMTITSGASAGVYYPIHYKFEANDTRLWISNYIGNIKDIESSSPSKLVLTNVKLIENTTNQWVKYKYIYKKV